MPKYQLCRLDCLSKIALQIFVNISKLSVLVMTLDSKDTRKQ